jgi:hypothetical protein
MKNYQELFYNDSAQTHVGEDNESASLFTQILGIEWILPYA